MASNNWEYSVRIERTDAQIPCVRADDSVRSIELPTPSRMYRAVGHAGLSGPASRLGGPQAKLEFHDTTGSGMIDHRARGLNALPCQRLDQ